MIGVAVVRLLLPEATTVTHKVVVIAVLAVVLLKEATSQCSTC